MRAKFLFVPLVILGLISLSTAQTAEPEFIEGKVIMVPDGDEVRVKTSDGKTFAVRLLGIDAPEKDQDFGTNARRDLESRVLDKDVRVMIHRKDSEGRYMGIVFCEGQDIGVRVLENGSAWHYKRVSGEQSSEARARYAKAELKARESKIGLWSAAIPMPPWEFREEPSGSTTLETKAGTVQPSRANLVNASAEINQAPRRTPTPSSTERTYHLGPRGGCYYLNASGSKVYVRDKSLCSKP